MKRMVKPDIKGRVALGALAVGVSRFSVTIDKHNRIILEPYAEIPMKEKWLFDNKVALAKVQQGIEDAKAGRISERGSFSKYLDSED